jgi:aminoglycoside phosphotransferase family enzyme/predicted kinase
MNSSADNFATRAMGRLIEALLRPEAYPHATDELRAIETHISWVILTGQFAYKIKKPVDFGFVNFSGLDARRHFCQEELRLNRRAAPELYLDVVPIGMLAGEPRIGVEPAVEYAVRMHQFEPEFELDRLLESGRLRRQDLLDAAAAVARFQHALPPLPRLDAAQEFERVREHALDNLETIRATLECESSRGALLDHEAWVRDQLAVLEPVFRARAESGFVREGHGDLHLANIVRLKGRIVLFDCLEFDPGMRQLDVIDEASFLAMDLMARGQPGLAFIFLNAWLERTGDYGGLRVLRFYLHYRCLVRAKVACLGRSARANGKLFCKKTEYERYLGLARQLIEETRPGSKRPVLVMTHGFSGSGKTWASEKLISGMPGIRVSSDRERKRIHGVSALASSGSRPGGGIYDSATTKETYDRLLRSCRAGLKARFNMIADASFLRRSFRCRFIELAQVCDADPVILDCCASREVLRERLRRRMAEGRDVSEAGLEVLEQQLTHFDPLTEGERRICRD